MAKIIKRQGMWYSDFRQNGKRIRRALSPYKDKADELLKDLLAVRTAEKTGAQPKEVSWFYFREKYLTYCRENKSPMTAYMDRQAIEAIERVGRPLLRMTQMTPEYLEDFIMKWKAKKLSEKTGIAHMRRMKTALHWAEARKLAPMQNWTLVKTPADPHRVAHMDFEGFQKVLSICKGRWKTAAMLMGYAGLRSAEVRYLEWKDVDFKNHLIEIRAKEGWKPKGAKPGKSKDRVVDMPQELENYLQALPERSGYVLGGELTKKYTYRLTFRRLSKRVGFKVYAHMFRHTYASFLISSGSTLPEVGSLLGHSDARSTQIYTHMLPHARRRAVDRLQASIPRVTDFQVLQAHP